MALETPAAPAPCLCAYVELEAQVAMARSAWESNGTSQTGDLPLAGRAALAREQEQLWQESRSSFSVLSNSMEAQMGLATL